MEPAEIAVLAGAIALVAFTIAYNVIKRRKGKPSCGCSEAGCPNCRGCASAPGNAEKDGLSAPEEDGFGRTCACGGEEEKEPLRAPEAERSPPGCPHCAENGESEASTKSKASTENRETKK
ncbi:MAG: FeoB-associated Cys-rich membrane protein [Clostridiales bacterium]|nr:FeoB-associated Cys-rich membrane protein [Clostridiales bacterium]